MLPSFTIRTFTPADISAVFELELAYARVYPGAMVVPAEVYLSPGSHGGQDVFCAFDAEDGRLLAYAPIYLQLIDSGPADLPHVAWVEIKAHPDLADPTPVKDALYDCLMARIRALVAEARPPVRPVRVTFEYRTSEPPAIAYALARGYAYTESVFLMSRDLSAPIHDAPLPPAISLRRWKMEGITEQMAYLSARNECFPQAPTQLEAWQYYMTSPQWAAGTMIAAFAGEELVGCVSVFWNEDEIQQVGYRFGYTEDIFVRAPYRGQGIARAMITEGMRYLVEHDMRQARLAVRALNANALTLYEGLGYTVGGESQFYARLL